MTVYSNFMSQAISQLDPNTMLVIVTTIYTAATIVLGIIGYLQLKAYRQSSGYQKDAADAQKRAANATENAAELQVLLKLFEMLSSIDLSNARGSVFSKYCEVYGEDKSQSKEKDDKLLSLYDEIKVDVRKVEGAFDQAGVLFAQRKIDSKVFLELYALMVIRTYQALKPHVDREQTTSPFFAYWYRKLYDEAIDYYDKELKRPPEAIYCKKESKAWTSL